MFAGSAPPPFHASTWSVTVPSAEVESEPPPQAASDVARAATAVATVSSLPERFIAHLTHHRRMPISSYLQGFDTESRQSSATAESHRLCVDRRIFRA